MKTKTDVIKTLSKFKYVEFVEFNDKFLCVDLLEKYFFLFYFDLETQKYEEEKLVNQEVYDIKKQNINNNELVKFFEKYVYADDVYHKAHIDYLKT